MTYATGLYIRENIRLYYRPDSGTGIPVCVLTAEFRRMTPMGRFSVPCCPIRSSI